MLPCLTNRQIIGFAVDADKRDEVRVPLVHRDFKAKSDKSTGSFDDADAAAENVLRDARATFCRLVAMMISGNDIR
jgi:hypothetical protein